MNSKVVSVPLRIGLRTTHKALGLSTKVAGYAVTRVAKVVESQLAGQQQRSGDQQRPRSAASDRAASQPTATAATAATDATDAPAAAEAPAATAAADAPAETDAPTATATVEPEAPAPDQQQAPPPQPAVDDLAVDDLAASSSEAPMTPLTPLEADLKTIDDDDEVVAEFAEAGAEDGAGAELNLDEPWEGYAHATAEEVSARLTTADAAMLAVVELYEQAHKQRKTVLDAAARRLRQLSPS